MSSSRTTSKNRRLAPAMDMLLLSGSNASMNRVTIMSAEIMMRLLALLYTPRERPSDDALLTKMGTVSCGWWYTASHCAYSEQVAPSTEWLMMCGISSVLRQLEPVEFALDQMLRPWADGRSVLTFPLWDYVKYLMKLKMHPVEVVRLFWLLLHTRVLCVKRWRNEPMQLVVKLFPVEARVSGIALARRILLPMCPFVPTTTCNDLVSTLPFSTPPTARPPQIIEDIMEHIGFDETLRAMLEQRQYHLQVAAREAMITGWLSDQDCEPGVSSSTLTPSSATHSPSSPAARTPSLSDVEIVDSW